jgi:GlpG protein
VLSPESIWNGGYWTYLSSVFVHGNLAHLLFNCSWLWLLGTALERTIGWRRYASLVLAAVVATSGIQFWFTHGTGYGFSGVGFAVLAFMWTTRDRYPLFRLAVTRRIVLLFSGWLLLSLVLTRAGVWAEGTVAHVCGLVFGWLLGLIAGRAHRRWPVLVPLSALLVWAIVPMFWLPGSIDWVRWKALRVHERGDAETAVEWYTRAITMDPNDAWAYRNRSIAHWSLGNRAAAEVDQTRALELDPGSAQDR